MIRASTVNRVTAATITASSEDAAYPRTNLKTPDQPDNPAKTTVTTDSWWVIDYGNAQSVTAWGLIASNFTSVKIQANATDSWGAPSYDSGTLTVLTNPGNGRLSLFHRPGAQNFRYNRIFVPSQTPTDGASAFRLGGVWAAAALTSAPRDLLWDVMVEEIEPVEDRTTLSKRRQRLLFGKSLLHVSGRVQGSTGATPLLGDEIASWLAFERAWKAVDVALISFDDGHAGFVAVMRDLAPIRWTVSGGASEREIEWEEVAG